MRELKQPASVAFLPGAASIVNDIEQILVERSVFVAERNQMTDEPDAFSSGHAATWSAVRRFVATGRPIQIVLPAFPAKSANRQKTLSHLPDFGEYLALTYLNDVCRRISDIYLPGAKCVICSDGHVFSDLVGVSDSDVDAYGDHLRNMISVEGFTHLSDFSLIDFYRTGEFRGYQQLRGKLTDDFAVSTTTLKEMMLVDHDRQSTFNGIHRFLFEDMLVLNSSWSRNNTRNEAKSLAYEVIRRSDAWSRLVAINFPGAVRLSIHPHGKKVDKLGIKLVDGGGPWATPWHNAVIRSNGDFQLIKRSEAERAGARITYAGGKYAFFEL